MLHKVVVVDVKTGKETIEEVEMTIEKHVYVPPLNIVEELNSIKARLSSLEGS